ncbi:MAG: glycosyltransferase [Ruminococcus sp.]|nr:glycosyltransferase [Ruminococcus sp.]
MPRVSIILPVYNVENCIERCLLSLTNQTLSDIEILAIDDGSTDNSGKICDDFANTDSRITVVHKENEGPSAARNIGISKANGEYIGFVDSDDYVDEEMFETLYNLAKNNDVDVAMCSYCIFNSGKIEKIPLNYRSYLCSNSEIKKELLYLYYSRSHAGLYSLCNKIYKNSFLSLNAFHFNEKLRRAEDAWFNYEVLRSADSFAFSPQQLYYYCQNTNSIMHTPQKNQYHQWVENRQKLLEDNQIHQFRIDYNQFYYEFLYKVSILCREFAGEKNYTEIQSILDDPFYQNATNYISLLPQHIRILHFCGHRSKHITILLYRIWSIITHEDRE